MWKKPVLYSLAVLLGLPLPAHAAVTQVLTAATRWSGEVRLEAPVQVAKGVVLEIAAGSVVRPATPDVKISVFGAVQVRGTAAQPVIFVAPPGWKGIELVDTSQSSHFEFAEFKGAEVAISGTSARFAVKNCLFRDCEYAIRLLRESYPEVENSFFEGNRIGIDNEMKSAATVRKNLFRGHRKSAILSSYSSRGTIEKNRFEKNVQGIALMQNNPGRISDNSFVGNQIAIYCYQTQNTPEINGNRFSENQTAIDNTSFASPLIRNNNFTHNATAIRNDQLGTPLVSHNLLRSNKIAIYNYRRSNPTIENNLIEQNELALFCDYSSYPSVRRNNFKKNLMAVKLGIYQSGDWERRFGSSALMQKVAAARKSRNPHLDKSPGEIQDIVDVSHNWWGDDTTKLKRAGATGNLEMFHDRRDQPQVVYEGFDGEHYTLDLIVFAPWLTNQVVDSGPSGP